MAVMRKLLMQLHAVAQTGHSLDGGIRSVHLKTLYIQHRYSSDQKHVPYSRYGAGIQKGKCGVKLPYN